MKQSSPYIKKWRVLIAEVTAIGEMKRIPTDITKYSLEEKDIVLVIRINGQLTAWNPEKTTQDIAAIINTFKTTKQRIVGIEIDHDCATSKLSGYISFLKKIRSLEAIKNKTLSITTLPAWINSPHLITLLSLTDEAVLQVHSVSDPKQGLINATMTKKWLKAFDRLTPVPFYVALPTYSSKVAWDDNGKIIGVESEARRSFAKKNSKNIISDPHIIERLIATLHQYPYKRLKGITWFRLPTKNDRRAWSLATWINILQGKKITTQLDAIAVNRYINKNYQSYDIHVINRGNIDTTLPKKIEVSSTTASCYVADALNYYQYNQHNGKIIFQRIEQSILKSGQKHIVGWVHCNGQGININVQK